MFYKLCSQVLPSPLPLYNKKVLHIIFVYTLAKDHNFLISTNITWVIISRKMKLAGYIACMAARIINIRF